MVQNIKVKVKKSKITERKNKSQKAKKNKEKIVVKSLRKKSKLVKINKIEEMAKRLSAGKTLISGTLNENGIKDSDILIFKDLGVQISWRLVYVIEYLGPIIIFPFFYFCDKYVYSHTNKNKHIIQIFSLWFLLFHFIKREFESLFIHRFSNATMPIIRVPINCGHYW
ncbi:hypothetical protein PFFVO_05626 [Plasmodium falciparum Vietnam Oak-Knoll (FVO)]|uniref:Uncharacterized protein n=1 Tax=Plasmodium falciparum Vietnam Oak-Knoll (FVO) TaxID=1036723 RepID=A0A024UYK1_PLAFA|nr:hypothetical protein PFFVO_05626 [Plasmodium falciparum Vietnam Oak-Knoll (FVO)]